MGVIQPLKTPNVNSACYAGAITECKAAEHVLEIERQQGDIKISLDLNKEPFRLVFVKPILIVDGPLLSAEITTSGEIEIEEISFAPMRFGFRTDQYKARGDIYLLDIVQISHLDEYLKKLELRQDNLMSGLLKLGGLE